MESRKTRRDFLRASAVVGTGLVLSSCAGSETNTEEKAITSPTPDENKMSRTCGHRTVHCPLRPRA